jgi:hypothetical protein
LNGVYCFINVFGSGSFCEYVPPPIRTPGADGTPFGKAKYSAFTSVNCTTGLVSGPAETQYDGIAVFNNTAFTQTDGVFGSVTPPFTVSLTLNLAPLGYVFLGATAIPSPITHPITIDNVTPFYGNVNLLTTGGSATIEYVDTCP